ncbi:MAG: hypothetical protein M3063_01615 [Actinomycetota bacterium]|nr:hypothetical protein [Actinomycetota bacterium]
MHALPPCSDVATATDKAILPGGGPSDNQRAQSGGAGAPKVRTPALPMGPGWIPEAVADGPIRVQAEARPLPGRTAESRATAVAVPGRWRRSPATAAGGLDVDGGARRAG